MSLFFITGNQNKFAEVKTILPQIELLRIDLPELQEINPKKIIETKLQAAFEHNTGEFIVEDTSLYLDCLNGLPGPFIKWFEKTVGLEGLATITDKMGNNKAMAKVLIGYAKNRNEMYYFEGVLPGTIVPPRGTNGFGWDSIFQPDGLTKTYAEMTMEEKNQLSMRKVAALKLKEFLDTHR
jgi:non-canonical purine NTP pyrophosphatase (RdgB/HAM1 family)